jgi:hypothetical protein
MTMTKHMVKLMRQHGNHYRPGRSYERQGVVDRAQARQAAAMDTARRRRSVVVSNRPRRAR